MGKSLPVIQSVNQCVNLSVQHARERFGRLVVDGGNKIIEVRICVSRRLIISK